LARREAGLGELELEVMKVVWEKQPCTVQQVADVLCERRGCARTTVLTVMQRLHGKKFLKRRKREGVFHYSTTEERGEVMSSLIGNFVDKVLDGSALPFVAYLAEAKGLSREQVDALRTIARNLEKEAGEEER